MRHPTHEHYVFLIDIIDDAIDSVDICTDLLSDFYDFDLSSFDRTCDDSYESTTVCNICVEISSAILIVMQVQVQILLFLFHQLSTFPCLPLFSHLPWN